MASVAGVAPEFSSLLARSMDGVARVVLRHRRRDTFRWLGVAELTVGLVLCVCAIPVWIALFFASAGDVGSVGEDSSQPGWFERMSRRLHSWHHDLVLTVYGPDQQLLAEAVHTPKSPDEGDAILCAIVAMAQTQGAVVVEILDPLEMVAAYHGGRPLLALPEAFDPTVDRAQLAHAGFESEDHDDGMTLRRSDEPRSHGAALLLFFLLLLFLPFFVVTADGRDTLREAWRDMRRVPPACTTLRFYPDRVHFEVRRGDDIRESFQQDLRALLAVRFGASLGYDRQVTRRGSELSLIEAAGIRRLPLYLEREGLALRNLLVFAATRAQHGHQRGATQTRCPYCAAVYLVADHSRCPSCGAFPGDLLG